MINDPENKYKYDADDPYYFPSRFNCATEAVGKVVDHYYTNGSSLKTDGSIDDFLLSSYDNSFKIRNIYTYALQATNGKASSNTLTDTQISYFTNINITVS